jgi:hypothetical protein
MVSSVQRFVNSPSILSSIYDYPYNYNKGSVKVWDPRQKDEPVANMEPGAGQDHRDCWCVAFGMVVWSKNVLTSTKIQ